MLERENERERERAREREGERARETHLLSHVHGGGPSVGTEPQRLLPLTLDPTLMENRVKHLERKRESRKECAIVSRRKGASGNERERASK